MKLVIVESPAKAKTINKYLGDDFKVLASLGHVRDLPRKSGSVVPEQNFLIKYEILEKSIKHLKDILKFAQESDEIYLATDPDREGESISWHVIEVLKNQNIITDVSKVKRITFNEITKKAVLDAISSPRELDINLINAQQARRALDYLVGFTLSPILWRKLPGCRSAGRVQSVALRLICEREDSIKHFKPQEYWNITVNLLNSDSKPFISRLSHVNGKKLEKFSIKNKDSASNLVNLLKKKEFHINYITKKQKKRKPSPPFITSSLQQEAYKKLGFSTKKTMQVAQKLYEGVENISGEITGLITYIRTDGVMLSNDSINSIRLLITKCYGEKYLPKVPRLYTSKSKNAQEAHEAIRPTDISIRPETCSLYLDKDQQKLYDLIWKRTIASQMCNVEIDVVSAELNSEDKVFILRSAGSTITFDGFYKVYREREDNYHEQSNIITLPLVLKDDKISVTKINSSQHFTEPQSRFSEASLVKALEELGIGRPSTYASIISVLQDRKYVRVEKKRFFPNDLGRLVTTFLVGFFKKYVEYDFTANLESELDKVAEGKLEWKKLLVNFWAGFNQNIDKVKNQHITDVIDYIEDSLGLHLYGEKNSDEYKKNKKCPSCTNGKLNLRLGKYGPFLACSNYPNCIFKKQVLKSDSTKLLGQNVDKEDIYLKKGPYGWYIQVGSSESKLDKPRRVPITSNIDPETFELSLALKLLKLPMVLGAHPETNEEIIIGVGKFGLYLKYCNKFTSIPKLTDPFIINIKDAVEILAMKKKIKKIL